MLFLIEYNRNQGRLVNFQSFGHTERERAERARLDTEIDLNRRKVEHEVVLLEAESETALRRTHRRYFESLDELTAAPVQGAASLKP